MANHSSSILSVPPFLETFLCQDSLCAAVDSGTGSVRGQVQNLVPVPAAQSIKAPRSGAKLVPARGGAEGAAGGAETATSCQEVGKGPVPAGQEYVSLGNISCHTFTPPAESLERSGATGEQQFWTGQRRRRRRAPRAAPSQRRLNTVTSTGKGE